MGDNIKRDKTPALRWLKWGSDGKVWALYRKGEYTKVHVTLSPSGSNLWFLRLGDDLRTLSCLDKAMRLGEAMALADQAEKGKQKARKARATRDKAMRAAGK